MNNVLRRTGVSFLFRRTSAFLQPRDIEMSLVARDRQAREDRREQLYNQMFCCCEDMGEMTRLSLYDRVLERCGQFMEARLEIIGLQSSWLLLWNIFLYFITLTVFVENLFVIFILSRIKSERVDLLFNTITQFSAFILYFCDMLLIRTRVMVHTPHLRLETHSQVLKYYMAHYLWVDLLAMVILLVDVVRDGYLNYLKLAFYIKTVSLVQINREISFKLFQYPFLRFCYQLIKYTSWLVFLTFILACVYFIVDIELLYQGSFFLENGFLWLTASPSLQYTNLYVQFEWFIWFQYALFFVVQTVRGCAYGSVTARSPPEFLFSNLAMVTIGSVFAYYTKVVIDVIQHYRHHSRPLLTHLTLLAQVEKQTTLSNHTNHSKYARFITADISTDQFAFEQVAYCLSTALNTNLSFTLKQYFLLRWSLLSKIGAVQPQNQAFLTEVSGLVKSREVHQNQYLFRKGELSTQTLFLCEPKAIIVESEQLGYQVLKAEWSLIGIRQFFIDKRPLYSAKARQRVLLDYILKSEFMGCLRSYPLELQKYWEAIEGIRLNQESTDVIELKCCCCSNYHLQEHCSRLFGWKKVLPSRVQKSVIYQMELWEKANRRKEYRRRPVASSKMLKRARGQHKGDEECVFVFDAYFVNFNL